MPKTEVVFFKEADGSAPVEEWLEELMSTNEDAYRKCVAMIELLESIGHELRRPFEDALRDGIRELRTKHHHVQYRILYFYNGKDFAVLAHSIIKTGAAVPDADIKRALDRKRQFELDSKKHSKEIDLDA